MANVFLKDIEVEAGKVLNFLTKAQAGVNKAGQAAPTVVAGLGTILGAVSAAVASGSAAVAAGGLNLPLDAETLASVKSVWPEIVAFASSLGIKL